MSKPLKDREYASWLEEGLQHIQEDDPQSIAILYRDQDGNVATGYWNCDVEEKSCFASHIQADAMYAIVKANAADIVAAAEDPEETEDE